MKKVLLIRFSSIGDIVLTTPVLRALKEQAGVVELHFLTKARYASLLETNPRIDRLYTFDESLWEVLPALRAERYDFIVDLHNNLRSIMTRFYLRRPARAFPKLNLRKWLFVRFKWNWMPDEHLVHRYMKAAQSLGVQYDGQGLEHFIPPQAKHELQQILQERLSANEIRFAEVDSAAQEKGGRLSTNETNLASIPLIAVAIGGTYATKRLPTAKLIELCLQLPGLVVLLGGKADEAEGERIAKAFAERPYQTMPKLVLNLCGQLSLQQSASVLAKAQLVIAHDTGMMHLAAALKKPLICIWGNTVPELGMYPLYPSGGERSFWAEVHGLPCRPCSKLGYVQCPKGHFHCMTKQSVKTILEAAQRLLEQNGHLSFISEKN